VQCIATEPTVIKEAALLVYSAYGVRVAVFDLRTRGLFDVNVSSVPLEFEVCVPTLPLVEGDYRLGFYIATNEEAGDYLDVASFTVGSPRQHGGIVPYPAEHRGFVDLDFSIRPLSLEALEACTA
jgi:hypothetical protein